MVTPKDTRRSDGAAAWSCVEKNAASSPSSPGTKSSDTHEPNHHNGKIRCTLLDEGGSLDSRNVWIIVSECKRR